MCREFFQGQVFTDMGIDIGENLIHLGVVAGRFALFFGRSAAAFVNAWFKTPSDPEMWHDLRYPPPKPGIGAQFMDKIDKPRLLLLRKVKLMRHIRSAKLKTMI